MRTNFKGKYDTLIESTITRFEMGGILSGDLVKLRKDYTKNEKIQAMTEQMKAMLEDMANSDLNIRVSAVKSIRPTTTGYYGGGHNSGTRAPTDHWVDIVKEYAPGLWRDVVTVPIEILEVVDTNGNLAPVPDSVKRKSVTEMPKEVESPDADRKMTDVNTKQKFVPSTDDGRNQTSKPKKVEKKNLGKLTMEKSNMEDHPYNQYMKRKHEEAMKKIAKKFKKKVEDVTDDDIRKYNESYLTLEDVYSSMGQQPQQPTPAGGNRRKYTLSFGEPYGKNPDEVIKKIQTMPKISNNMTHKVIDPQTIELDAETDIEPEEFQNMLTNVIKGGVTVSDANQNAVTSFNAQKKPAVVSSTGTTPPAA